MELTLVGGCFCGRVRYRCGAPLCSPTACHCESCRRVAGAHVVAWFTVSPATLVFTAGRPAEFHSSPPVCRGFCAACGTPLTYRHAGRPEEIDITLASLDAPAQLSPADHIHMEDALPWDRPNDGLPLHPQTRPVA